MRREGGREGGREGVPTTSTSGAAVASSKRLSSRFELLLRDLGCFADFRQNRGITC